MNRPMWSAPTRVISPVRRPRRAAPMAVLVGLPPTYLAKRGHVLEPAADLLAVEVDTGAADRDEIETPVAP